MSRRLTLSTMYRSATAPVADPVAAPGAVLVAAPFRGLVSLLVTGLVSASVVLAQARRFPDFPLQDALHYHLDLKVDLAQQQLTGAVKYEIRALAALKSVRFHARKSPRWHVEFRGVRDQLLTAEWSKDTVRVSLPNAVARGQTFTIYAKLAGTPVDGFYFKKNRHGEILAFTDHYSIRARGWLPCEDHPADRAKWTTRLVYTAGNEAIIFGTDTGRKGDQVPDGFAEMHATSATEVPPYMYALVVGPFTRIPEAGDPRLVPHLVYAKDAEKARPLLTHHAAWIAAMESAIGKYPYGKYTTVQCPTRWGGFEAPGNVQLAEGLFDRNATGTLAHELAHMWFGDGIGYARWREVWLSEGFASYFGPWMHAKTGGPTLQERLQSMRDRWRKSFEGRTKTVRDDSFPHPDRALNSNTYPKGAWVLHMLRGELGDEVFFKALRTYFERCSGRSVITKDFVAIVEEVAEQHLGWFFDQWLNRVDCPHIELRTGDGVTIIKQVQKGKPYRFWFRYGWLDEKGKPQSERVRIEKAVTEIPSPGVRTQLRADPDVELLFRNK